MTDDPERRFEEDAAADDLDDLDDATSTATDSDRRLPPRDDLKPEFPWRVILFLLLAVLVVVFAVQNTQSVELRILGWSWELPLVIIILATVVVSVLLAEILGGIIKRRRRLRRLEREELKRLRGES